MGSRLPLLLIPGSLCDGALFRPQVDFFCKSRVVVICDFSDCNRIETMAQKILSSAPERFFLCGLSMGGMIALEIIRQASDRVAGLALLDTNYRAELPDRIPVRRNQIAAVSAGGMRALLEIVENELFPKYLSKSCDAKKQHLKTILEMAATSGSQAFIDQWQALIYRQDSEATLRSLSCPTLVACGEDDELCNVATHQAISEFVGHAQLHIVADCGHLSTLEKPDKIIKILDCWISQVEQVIT